MLKISKNHEQKLKKYLGVKNIPGNYEKNLWDITEKYTPLFSKIPGVLCICICNSLAMNACHENSDIDLFIITKKNRLWTARIISTFMLSLIGLRKTSQNHAGKFCLSFFISEEDLSLEHIALEDDVYLIYWIHTLTPIVNKKSIFEKFIEKNISWCEIKNKNYTKLSVTDIEHSLGKTHKLLTSCGDFCEKLLKILFLHRTKKSFQKLGKPFGVVISDTMLKFHNTDKRKVIKNSILK